MIQIICQFQFCSARTLSLTFADTKDDMETHPRMPIGLFVDVGCDMDDFVGIYGLLMLDAT